METLFLQTIFKDGALYIDCEENADVILDQNVKRVRTVMVPYSFIVAI